MITELKDYGLTDQLEKEMDTRYPRLFIGRIISEHKNLYKVITDKGEILAEIKGSLGFEASSTADYPAVGDWVALDRNSNQHGNGIIHGVLTRSSKLSRKMAGNTFDEQIIATNIDTLFICMALNNDFNLRRLERYISVAWDSGATPVIILTKLDLCDDLEQKLIDVNEVAAFIDIHPISSLTREGIDLLEPYVVKGKTIAFIGSSGVGKSTLINALIGEEHFKTGGIREDDHKGKHTTTHRELISLENGCSLIDTPGMREFALLDDTSGVTKSFDDIEDLILRCRFTNCTHTNEPGCKIRAALEDGSLEKNRYESYQKLLKEAAYAKRKQSIKEQRSYARGFSKKIKDVKNSSY